MIFLSADVSLMMGLSGGIVLLLIALLEHNENVEVEHGLVLLLKQLLPDLKVLELVLEDLRGGG